MDFERANPDCKFSVPDKVTVRQQLAYYSETAAASGSDIFERYWQGAKALITSWQCEIMPDHKIDLATVTNPKIAELVVWAGVSVKNYLDTLEELPKNS